jgi:hypothetical protein
MKKQVKFLLTPQEHAHGATGKSSLGDEILAFVYPIPAPRIYFTFFCPPLRIVAIDITKRQAVFDKVIQPSQFVFLPPTCLVLEMDPGVDYKDVLEGILAGIDQKTRRAMAGVDPAVSVKHLIFGLFADALAEIRRVKTFCLADGEVDSEILKSKLPPWERGKIVGAAGFVIDYQPTVSWRIPNRAVDLSRQIMQIEKDYHDELIAASAAGIPWQSNFDSQCIRCSRAASWRFALPVPCGMPVEVSWRLQRPENAVPLCRVCAGTLKFSQREEVRIALVSSLWGPRFDALKRWYLAVQNLDGYKLPQDWIKEDFPLWPEAFGGEGWSAGSGAIQYCEPREPINVQRTNKQRRTLVERFGVCCRYTHQAAPGWPQQLAKRQTVV